LSQTINAVSDSAIYDKTLIDQDKLYSNLGLLLSDQCVHTIKVAVFQGTDQTIFKDRRDYSFSASALISIYADRIEFVSIGGLMPGIELEDIMAGISVCRNQDLANVFYHLHLIEAYGAGMAEIMKAYEGMEERPTIETTKNAFKITLPDINAKYETESASVPRAESIASSVSGTEKSLSNEEKVLEYARSHGVITRNDVIELPRVSTSTASRIIRRMVKNNLLKQNGKAGSTNYTILK